MKYQLISGPVSYSRYKIDNKKIFLFGDVHFSKDYQCSRESITIPQLLNNLAKKYDKQEIDLFLEVPYA